MDVFSDAGEFLIMNFCCRKDVDSFITGEVPNVFAFWFRQYFLVWGFDLLQCIGL